MTGPSPDRATKRRPPFGRMAMLLAVLLLGGCGGFERPAPSVPGGAETETLRFWAGEAPASVPARTLLTRPGYAQHYSVLALSGGGPDGAYGAGLVAGLSAAGRRPDFDVVTGVSTGALMAPFVFLGPTHDAVLRELYTGPGVETLLEGGLLSLLDQPGLYRHRAIRARLEQHITPELLAAIAAEHQRGRRLYVATGNFDAQRMVVWDMGAISARGTVQDLILFREVLAAAMSIPVLFPLVALPAAAEPSTFPELHGDAGLFAGFYAGLELFPARGSEHCGRGRLKCSLYVIIHNKLLPEPERLILRVDAIGARALQSMVKANLNHALQAASLATRNAGIGFHAARLRTNFPDVLPVQFDRAYMQRIYEEGFAHGRDPAVWRDIDGLLRPDLSAAQQRPWLQIAHAMTKPRSLSDLARVPQPPRISTRKTTYADIAH
ncbi:MAG: patatin-like phospholipase family protein [Roseomonas sp.]|nr:patatin-like phospholipase family protein [Roseomonas sp.]MCA3379353.1 patatin-like phospholipase family protein [Roseomonas sp.]